VLTSDALQVYPGSTEMQLGPGQFPLTSFGVLKASESRFAISLPGRYAWRIISGFRSGNWAKRDGFTPDLEYRTKPTASGTKSEILSPFYHYIDYCGWWKNAWDWIDSRVPLYDRASGFGLHSYWAWQAAGNPPSAWSTETPFSQAAFLLRAVGLADRHRHLVGSTSCCQQDVQAALRDGSGFSIGGWLTTNPERLRDTWSAVYPFGLTGGMLGLPHATAATQQRTVYFSRDWVRPLSHLANYWAHAAVTLYCLAFTWRPALAEAEFEELLADCQRCVQMVESCAVPLAATVIHELFHALKPSETQPGHIRHKCCQNVLAADWNARVLYSERLFPLMRNRRIVQAEEGETEEDEPELFAGWGNGMVLTGLDTGMDTPAYILPASRFDASRPGIGWFWFNQTTNWAPFDPVELLDEGERVEFKRPVAVHQSDCDGFSVRAVLRANPLYSEPYRSPNFWAQGVSEHPDYGRACY